jgi:exopolyphosphatase/guanosine-5'-triphosphate,3'-diphosphate pyrophosphatase
MKRYAAIDIGTNTILLLIVGQTPDGLPQTIMDLETTTRLGEGLVRTRRIKPHAMQKSLAVIENYLALCSDMGVTEVVAVGTSSLREATNRSEFVQRVKRRCGLGIEIISGQEEARLSYLAVAKDKKWSSRPLTVIDIGGGSTEWIHGDPLGPLKGNPPLVGIGGTITALFSVKHGLTEFDSARIHHGLLELRDIEQQIELFRTLPLKERKAIAGLPPERADIIIAGATILLHSLLQFGSNRAWVSSHGLRYGILFERFFK